MSIFISYSFEDETHLGNVTDELEDAGLEYWKTADTRSGELLSKQLQEAISRSELCIFIATRHSVSSPWCNAELGAFWGAKKRVLIFLPDDTIREGELPKQFLRHFQQRRIKRLVSDCKKYLEEASSTAGILDASTEGLLLRQVTREDLAALIEDALFQSNSNLFAASAFLELEVPLIENEAKSLQQPLRSFVGLTRLSVHNAVSRWWPVEIGFIQTTTGIWNGYAKSEELHSYNYAYKPCIFFSFDEKFKVEAVALFQMYVLLDKNNEEIVRDPIASVGAREFGTIAQRR
jgi:hypothetical protein